MDSSFFDDKYFETGPQTGKSLYQNYRWIPDLTIPLAHHILDYTKISKSKSIMDFGCAKGYLVYALRLLNREAYGVDISAYAIEKSPKEISAYLKTIKPLSNNIRWCDLIICKDILEHIPYESIEEQLKIIRNSCESIFAIIPLGKDGKYINESYENDKSHCIREDISWWEENFIKADFHNLHLPQTLGHLKQIGKV